jgi:hypothetical protein
MRNLIAERPNLVPTGIGNSATLDDIDMTVLQDGIHETETEGDTEPGDATSDGPDMVLDDDIAREIMATSDTEEDNFDIAVPSSVRITSSFIDYPL